MRGCTATICGGWLPVRRRSSAVDLRGGGPLYAGGGLTPRKGGVVLASATSFSPFFLTLFRALVANYNQSIAIFTVYSHLLFTYRLGSLRTRSGPHRAISFLLRRARGGKSSIIEVVPFVYLSIYYFSLFHKNKGEGIWERRTKNYVD